MSQANGIDVALNINEIVSSDSSNEGGAPPQKRMRAPKQGRCIFCGKEYSYGSSILGTSTLGRHMPVCPKNPDNLRRQKNKLQKKENDREAASGAWIFDQKEIRKALVKMVIIDELPFSHVEKEGFREFMEAACPDFVIPTRFTIARDCIQLFLDEKLKLKNFFQKTKQRVSLTIDTWTSNQTVNYMCLTSHFIDDDWVMHKKIINLTPIFSHKGEVIGRGVERCLFDWGINNVMTITVDNASSNDVAIAYLKRRLDNCVLDGKFLHMRCVSQIINLVVRDGLKQHDESIARIRAAVRFVRQSPSRLEKFKECAKECGIETKPLLSLDCLTRWDSTFDMLNTCEKFEKAFNLYEIEDKTYQHDLEESCGVPARQDWHNIRKFATFLEIFYKLTNNISGSLYVTSDTFFPEIVDLDLHLRKHANSFDLEIQVMALQIREKYDKYWGNVVKMNMLLYVAAVLDPRHKMEFIEFSFENLYKQSYKGDVSGFSLGFSQSQDDSLCKKMIELVRSTTYELFHEYKSKYGPPAQLSQTQSKFVQSSPGSSTQLMHLFKMHKLRSGTGTKTRSELDKYLNEGCDDYIEDFDVLLWWKNNSPRFPILSKMAKDVLAIPISTVASESAFSIDGPVLDPFRSSLSPPIVEALVCTQNWIRKSRKQIKVEQDLENLAKELFDTLQIGGTNLVSTSVDGTNVGERKI